MKSKNDGGDLPQTFSIVYDINIAYYFHKFSDRGEMKKTPVKDITHI